MALINYKIVGVAPCVTEDTLFKVTALLSQDDISDLMPYINAALKFCAYEPFAPTLTFKCKGSPVVLYPDRVVVGHLREADDAEAILDAVVSFINRVDDQKESLQPDHMPKELTQPAEIYFLLPRTDCGDCGEATCIDFTVKLVKGDRKVADCPHLSPGTPEKVDAVLEKMDDTHSIFDSI
jgi:ArsR family metal-binding transcriptional regulator